MEGIEFILQIPSHTNLKPSVKPSFSRGCKNTYECLPGCIITKIPYSYSELHEQIQSLFKTYQILTVSFRDPDCDLITLKNNADLQKAYDFGKKINNFLQIYIKAVPLLISIPETVDDSLEFSETPPDIIKETYFIPCYKCSHKNINCPKCHGKGFLDVYSEPKLNFIRTLIRNEVTSCLPKLLSDQPSLVTHPNTICRNCGISPIIGVKFKCSICKDYDFCEKCEKTKSHEHPFIKIRTPEQDPQFLFCAVDETKKNVKGKNRQCDQNTRLLCRFVKDIIGCDGDVRAPGEVFVKSWRLRNDGINQWPQGCRVIFTNGDFGGDEAVLPALLPGEEKDVCVSCKSPDKEGRYHSYWRAVDPAGNRFGHRLCIQIVVKGDNECCKELKEMKEILGNFDLIKLAFQQAGGCKKKAAELLFGGNCRE